MRVRVYARIADIHALRGKYNHVKIDFKASRTPLESLKAVFQLNYSGKHLSAS